MSEATQALSPRTQALLSLIGNIKNGVIHEIIIRDGEPVVIKAGIQRIDLDKEVERDSLIKFVPMPFAGRSSPASPPPYPRGVGGRPFPKPEDE